MSGSAEEFFTPVGPTNGEPTAIGVTTSSVHVDLTGASYTTLKSHIDNGRLIQLQAEGDVWFRWSPNTSSDTVDETMVATGGTPANQTAWIPAGGTPDHRAPPGTQGIVVKAPVACKLRLWASSKQPASWTKS